MQSLLIREVREEDLNDLLKLELEAFKRPYSLSLLKREVNLPYSLFLVAEEEEQLLGYVSGWLVGQTAELNRIAVKKERRSEGIGKELLNSFIKKCFLKGIKEVFLEVEEDNEVARKLYSSFGFKEVGIRKGYYGGKDAVIYKLNLGG